LPDTFCRRESMIRQYTKQKFKLEDEQIVVMLTEKNLEEKIEKKTLMTSEVSAILQFEIIPFSW
jgi:hypothetical protein